MSKIQNFAEITPNIPFTEFNFYDLYRSTFEKSELGRIKKLLPLREMAENFGLTSRGLRPRRGRKSYFTPEGKFALMFLKMYTGLSCPKLTEAEFQIQMANNDNTIRVSVSPSDDAVSYVSGIIIEDDYAALGENGLVSYINGLVSDGAELKAGVSDELYSDLFWHTRYYAFAAQINDGTVYGTPAVESVRTYRPYVEFAPEGAMIAPYAVSDNGMWVVGNYTSDTAFYTVIYFMPDQE